MRRLFAFARNNALSLIAFLLPILFFVLIAFAFPRHYSIFFTDGEQTMYYGSKVVLVQYYEAADLSHPGIISYYLGALILKISGLSVANTELFLRIGYLLVALATSLILVLFSRLLLKKLPFGLGLLALVLFFCFPPILLYSDMLCAGSLIFLFSLLALILFWSALDSNKTKRVGALFALTGVVLGISLANHVISLILLGVVGLDATIKAMTLKETPGKRLLVLVSLPLSAVVSYGIAISPFFFRFRQMWESVFERSSIRPSFQGLWTGLSILTHPGYLLPETITQVVVLVLFLLASTLLLIREGRGKAPSADRSWMFKATLIVLLLLGFLYTLSTTADFHSPGVSVRYTLAFNALFSLALVFLWERWGYVFRYVKTVNLLAAGLSLMIFVSSIAGFLSARADLINKRSKISQSTIDYFMEKAGNDGRIAFWDGSPGDFFGEASFHFWGDYRYGGRLFEQEILSAFPRYSFLDLRAASWVLSTPDAELYTGEGQGLAVDLIVFPSQESEDLIYLSLDTFRSKLFERLGPVTFDRVKIDSTKWIVYQILNSR